ncbi:MAG: hypothetical protein J6J66_06580 [Clostridia bacterium]|nr:hypothetical protein [Clostridia bacterium]
MESGGFALKFLSVSFSPAEKLRAPFGFWLFCSHIGTAFFNEKHRKKSVFVIRTGAGIFFLHFAEKMLDFFAFFRYHIFRSRKNATEPDRRQSGDREGENGVALSSFAFGKQHL